jgi:hypothetical protein
VPTGASVRDARALGIVRRATNGTVNTGVTAAEYGDGVNHVSVLTVKQIDSHTIADDAALADGSLIYTFPAGVVVVDYSYMSMALTAASTAAQGDTPDVGLGVGEATGTVTGLSGTATFEDIITGQTAANASGTPTVITALPTGGVPLIIAAGAARTVYFNIADTWADDAGGDQTVDSEGTIVLVWRFLA